MGDAYRVVYAKPCEDPNHRLDERREILADGALIPLPPWPDPVPEPPHLCRHIVAGGQTVTIELLKAADAAISSA